MKKIPVPLLWLLTFPGTASSQGENPIIAMLPAAPAEMLACLPERVEGWKLTVSKASSGFEEWLNTVAKREFEMEAVEGEKMILRKVSISIEDTGGYPPAFSLFSDFEPQTGDGFEKRLIAGYPALIIEYEEKEFEAQILVGERFLIRIFCENQPRRFLKEWLDRIDLRTLKSLPAGARVPLPEEITVHEIDELNKEKNRSYRLAITSSVRADEESIELQDED